MKRILLLVIAVINVFAISSCDKESGDGLRKSDIVGTWEQDYYTMKIKSDNTYEIYKLFNGMGYSYELSGTYSFDPKAKVWVQHRNDGHSYTNVILLLDDTTFSYMDQYGNNEIWKKK